MNLTRRSGKMGRHSRHGLKPTWNQILQIRHMWDYQLIPVILALGSAGAAVHDFTKGGRYIWLGLLAVCVSAIGFYIFARQVRNLPNEPSRRRRRKDGQGDCE
jgi:hypothetical protein